MRIQSQREKLSEIKPPLPEKQNKMTKQSETDSDFNDIKYFRIQKQKQNKNFERRQK